MEKVRIKFQKLVNSSNLPFLIFFIILLLVHVNIKNIYADDLFFANQLTEENNIITFLTTRYNTWSSRLIIETVLVTVAKFGLAIWRIVNIGMYIILAKSISKICLNENNKKFNYIICGLLLLLPIPILNGTGWIATTTNYLWVVSLGVFFLSIIKDYIQENPIPKWQYIFYILALIYACNQEQMAAVIFAVTSVFLLVQLLTKGYKYILKNQKFLLLSFLITIFSLIFILTCPGNDLRNLSEINSWYPEYVTFNLFEKVELGLTSTMKYLVLDTNALWVLFTLITFIGVCKYNKNIWIKIIALIPFLSSIFYAVILEYLGHFYFNIYILVEQFMANKLVMSLDQISIKYMIIMLGYILILLLIPFNIYNIFKNNVKTYVCTGIYLLGLATRFIMGFSPTVFASGERTFTFLYIAFIMCTMFILDKILLKKEDIEDNN